MPKLDLCGLTCPQPVLECRKFLEQGPTAFVAYVDNEAASVNVRRFLEQRGFCATIEKEGDVWRIDTAKKDVAQQSGAHVAQQVEKKILVFITTERLGHGDDELGAKLMAAFLATLPELGDALWRVILLNGGVKLAAAPGGALQALRKLEQAGVSSKIKYKIIGKE